jgi:hypothetical protein
MNSLRLLYGIPDHKLIVANNGVDYKFWNIENVSENDSSEWKKENSRN